MSLKMKRVLRVSALLGIGLFAFLFTIEEAAAAAKKMSIRGRLTYRGGRGKSFYWNLRFYSNTGIVIGYGSDKDGYAEFFGTYNRFTKRFKMVKHFKRRRGPSWKNKFYYRGKLRGRYLYGTARKRSFWGRSYATWRASVRYSRWKFTRGRPRRLSLRGKLRYKNGRSKSFYWRLRYYPSSGRCFGTVSDKDGRATFEGVYDRATRRIYLRKSYSRSRTFYYKGYVGRRYFSGTARKYSFISKSYYATWSARLLYKW